MKEVEKSLPSREELLSYVHEECSSQLQTQEAIVDVAIYVDKCDGRVKTPEIKEEVDNATDTAIKNAVERAGLLNKIVPGSGAFFIHVRKDEIYHPAELSNEEYEEMFEDVRRFLKDAEDDPEKRKLLSEKLECEEDIESIREEVESSFRKDRLNCLGDVGSVIERIKENDDIKRDRDYEPLIWRPQAHRYEVRDQVYNIGEE
jgi:hypothetical protein